MNKKHEKTAEQRRCDHAGCHVPASQQKRGRWTCGGHESDRGDYCPSSIHIHGRRWFERTNGNTYHRTRIYVDGEHVHTTPFAYGYGHHYATTAQQWLAANGYLPADRDSTCLAYICDDLGIAFIDEVDDFPRKRDL